MKASFNLETGKGLRLQHSIDGKTTRTKASLHRLTPEQFRVLFDNFDGSDEDTLDVNGYGGERKVRTAEINLGGLTVTMFSDVPAEDFIPIEG